MRRLLIGVCCVFVGLSALVTVAAARPDAHRLLLSARRSGHRLSVRISDAPAGGKCTLTVAAKTRNAVFTVWRVGKNGVAKVAWSVPVSAPGGIWSLVATCVKGNRRSVARAKVRWPGKGSGLLVSSKGGGKGGGNQSCQPIVEGGSGQVCFIGDPFATYQGGEDVGQCTWYAAGMRPDLDGITTGNASEWLKEASGKKPEGTTPVVGAIAVNTTADGGFGHVAYVASVENGGATLILDEANLHNDGGVFLNVATPASDFQGYIYGGPAGNGPGSGGSSGGGSTGGGTTPTGPPVMAGKPAVLVNSSYSEIDVFYRDTNGDLEDDSWSAASGQGYQTRKIATGVAGNPVAVVNSSYTQIDVFYRGTNGDLMDASWSDTPAGYTVRQIAGGVAGDPAALVNSAYDQIDVYYRDVNGNLQDASWNATPAGYTVHQIASGVAGDPAAIVNSAYDQIDVYYRDVNGNLQDASWSATPAGYTVHQIAGGVAGDPAALVNSAYDQIDVYYRDVNGNLQDASWNATPAGYQTQTLPTD